MLAAAAAAALWLLAALPALAGTRSLLTVCSTPTAAARSPVGPRTARKDSEIYVIYGYKQNSIYVDLGSTTPRPK